MTAGPFDRHSTVVVQRAVQTTLEHPSFSLIDANGVAYHSTAMRVRIGAGPGNDLVLHDRTVSSVHLEIQVSENGFRVRDLGSTNGTWIGNLRIFDAFIDDGTTLILGTYALVFRVRREKIKETLSERNEFFGMVGVSAAMRSIFSRIERVAKTDVTVLISGETGVGKEGAAWALYEASPRAQQPFVVVDCGAISYSLIESELFGHEKGAFTGAVNRRIGAFERAHGGTLFLDEIGELDLEMQPKLLRVLEQREIQRLGGDGLIPVDVRIMAATNRDLRAMVARGEFREDLYYRLAVFTIDLPPLRERKEDIAILIDHFLSSMGATVADLPNGALQRFLDYDWPGNARELKNAVERAVVLGDMRLSDQTIQTKHVAGDPAANIEDSTEPGFEVAENAILFTVDHRLPYKEQKAQVTAEFEEKYVRSLMQAFRGNVSAAARHAGIDRMSLHKILNRYQLDAQSARKAPSGHEK